jgi:lipid II:glycine glycyltransferase (peptidoglycan interpeptide bridge formation enzyme)
VHNRPVPSLDHMVLQWGAPMRSADRNGGLRRADDRWSGLLVDVQVRPDADTLCSWDRLVSTTPGTDVAQLSAWAAVRREAGFSACYVLVRSDDTLVAGALVLYRKVPGVGLIGYLPFGPVLPADEQRRAATGALCDALAHLARTRFAGLFVQPMAGGADVSGWLLQLGFRPSTAGIAPAASIAIDLARPIETLRADLRSGTRSSIKRAAAEGVRVRTGGEHDLETVASLLRDTAEHHEFSAASLPYLRTLHRELSPGGHLQIFLAERDGTPLAADVLTSSGGVLTLRMTGMRRSDDVRRTGAAALLRWETLVWAKANGYDAVDLGGVPPSAVDAIRAGRKNLADRVDGRTYYKASFGGDAFHRPPAVELLSSPLARLGYDLARRSTVGTRLLGLVKRLLRGAAR